jgi:predicted nucleotidyltransferase
MERARGEILRDSLRRALAARPEVLEAYIFGSTARGDEQEHSDVDVAVFVEPGARPEAPFGYAASLAAELMRDAGLAKVDVVVLNDAPPLLYGRVLNEGVRLVARDLAATTTREGRALSRYCDYLPQLAKIEAAHRARIRSGGFGR